ncbi:MAG: hypothetical protein LBH09_06180 [Peptococcaceae bacterium]|nr:hypothetical protein [Peptococcaceae bacterium]
MRGTISHINKGCERELLRISRGHREQGATENLALLSEAGSPGSRLLENIPMCKGSDIARVIVGQDGYAAVMGR